MYAAEILLEQLPANRRHLRVALVTETYPPEINGVAVTIGQIVNALQQRDHQVQLIRPRQGNEPLPGNAANLEQVLRPGIPIPNYSGLNIGLPAKRLLSRLWALRRPDVVHIATEGPLGWSALAAATKLRIPVVAGFHTNFHSYSSHYGFSWLKRPIYAYLRKFHNQAHLTLVPTATLRDELCLAGYRNVEVLARGVDSELFNPKWRSLELRRAWGVAERELAVVYVGRIAPEKNLGLLVRAFEAIEHIHPDTRLILVGDGPELAQLRSAYPRFVFCGPRNGVDLAQHYASSDAFLFPSTTETFGNVLIEAMASGLPVLGYDYAAAAEFVRHRENGLKVQFDHEADFIREAAWLARYPEAMSDLGRQARETALCISWETIFQRLEGFYQRLVSEREAAQETSIRQMGFN
ncbi:MAG: glycoside hydrolase [Hydrogenophilales bacterium CG03_land_8_20_14_0_80_62_28]|nr:glycosyltransferase family 1 protein [Betaproteobacteria bacterium]PIV23024.1 MAG: glycoside hydrolase [Hydrogenophilales bacterium CG03_land_8_20_14_0_80_62_28]PIW37637.1 MAG: glycoside hydrolase [Hydrogenophilales bacterium CG15_BIG_FIL_POST_REV_8_21_14_020_62_31]PIW71571.1 MAG: glycoside hydrolase [Hydrogenophilales bacterium CG12_big_fil_rev_8_21_14_0_65_61_21]PIX01453.1 MAG: glycoside hydrolase [Hydrogenophilales bacterium CG_4_8_14_3_um_filter_62_83]PIY98659.1 MAG: glycoside hydrolase